MEAHELATVPAEVIRTIAAVDPAIAQAPQGHFLLVDVLTVLGSPDQRQRLFAEVLAGGRLVSSLAERGGQHAQDLKTRLHGSGARTRLTGRKYYATGALTARWIGASALDEAGRLVLAFVPRNMPGVRLDQDWNVMGQRATVSGSVVFDDVPVEAGLVVPYQQAFEAAEALLAAAAATLDEVTRTPRNAAAAARGSVAVAQGEGVRQRGRRRGRQRDVLAQRRQRHRRAL